MVCTIFVWMHTNDINEWMCKKKSERAIVALNTNRRRDLTVWLQHHQCMEYRSSNHYKCLHDFCILINIIILLLLQLLFFFYPFFSFSTYSISNKTHSIITLSECRFYCIRTALLIIIVIYHIENCCWSYFFVVGQSASYSCVKISQCYQIGVL